MFHLDETRSKRAVAWVFQSEGDVSRLHNKDPQCRHLNSNSWTVKRNSEHTPTLAIEDKTVDRQKDKAEMIE